ncbi:MAG: hypothetical protein ACREUF_19300 [Solimonas sp.]
MNMLIEFWQQLTARPDFWGFICIPIVAAVVTWVHVWMALKLMFYPIDFIGLRSDWPRRLGINFPGFGWQGLIPMKARKMAGIVTDRGILKLGTVQEFMQQMEPDKVATHVVGAVMANIEAYVDEVMLERSPVLWENLPRSIKRRVYRHVREQIPAIMDGMVGEIIDQVHQLVDVRGMICDQIEQDKALIVRMFEEVGDRELAFIVNISFWIGLAFGLLQMVMFYFVPWHGGLPLYAAVLGWVTNWIALTMVFRPLEETRFGPWRLQGLFLKRQNEVADKFSEIVAHEVLTVRQFMQVMLSGERSEHTRRLIRRRLGPLLDSPVVRSLAQLSMGPGGYTGLKAAAVDKTTAIAMQPLSNPEFNTDRSRRLSGLLAERIRALSKLEFQDLLRPAFEEDEWILLALGALTGLVAGTIQLLLGFR